MCLDHLHLMCLLIWLDLNLYLVICLFISSFLFFSIIFRYFLWFHCISTTDLWTIPFYYFTSTYVIDTTIYFHSCVDSSFQGKNILSEGKMAFISTHIFTVSSALYSLCRCKFLSDTIFPLPEEPLLTFLVIQVCWWQILLAFYPKKSLFCLHFGNIFFARYRVQGCFSTSSSSTLRLSLHCFLTCIVFDKRSTLIFIYLFICYLRWYFFPLAAFKIIFKILSFHFNNLIILPGSFAWRFVNFCILWVYSFHQTW